MSRLPPTDLADIAGRGAHLWESLAGARVLVTGAAGFVGSWMLESLLYTADERELGITAVALVRDAAAFRASFPHLAASQRLTIVQGDVRKLRLEEPVTHVVHAASATSPARHLVDPADIIDTIVAGTRQVLDLDGVRRALIVSSGSVYDRGRILAPQIGEDDATMPPGDTLAERFGAAKRSAERAVEESGVPASIARIFTVVGPRLPIGGPFAVGQFLGDALANRGIRLTGDGSPVRSYLYSADLVSWLWTILLQGQGGRAYNVGSERACDIAEVADRVARLRTPRLSVALGPASRADVDRYVPDTRRAREELGLESWTSLPEALNRTWAWLRASVA